ncbi:MAG: hypothetical protein H0V89_02940, partial [Deltaproteobacteria bacterium]|nr:hypothetical protein [Deltaproteobacteria bacterium]
MRAWQPFTRIDPLDRSSIVHAATEPDPPPGFDVLLDSVRSEGQLDPMGRQIARRLVVDSL